MDNIELNNKLRSQIFKLVEEYTSVTGEFITNIEFNVSEEHSTLRRKRWLEYGRMSIVGAKIDLNTNIFCKNGEEIYKQNII